MMRREPGVTRRYVGNAQYVSLARVPRRPIFAAPRVLWYASRLPHGAAVSCASWTSRRPRGRAVEFKEGKEIAESAQEMTAAAATADYSAPARISSDAALSCKNGPCGSIESTAPQLQQLYAQLDLVAPVADGGCGFDPDVISLRRATSTVPRLASTPRAAAPAAARHLPRLSAGSAGVPPVGGCGGGGFACGGGADSNGAAGVAGGGAALLPLGRPQARPTPLCQAAEWVQAVATAAIWRSSSWLAGLRSLRCGWRRARSRRTTSSRVVLRSGAELLSGERKSGAVIGVRGS